MSEITHKANVQYPVDEFFEGSLPGARAQTIHRDGDKKAPLTPLAIRRVSVAACTAADVIFDSRKEKTGYKRLHS